MTKIKFVKKAGSWCVTYKDEGKHAQKWFSNEKEAKEFVDELKSPERERKNE